MPVSSFLGWAAQRQGVTCRGNLATTGQGKKPLLGLGSEAHGEGGHEEHQGEDKDYEEGENCQFM